MIKTSTLTKTIFNHQNQSQIINLYTPSTTPSSGSICETDPSSLSSSCKSNIDAQINEDIHTLPTAESTAILLNLIDKLKRELATVKQAKCQLATLYKVSSMYCYYLQEISRMMYIYFCFLLPPLRTISHGYAIAKDANIFF